MLSTLCPTRKIISGHQLYAIYDSLDQCFSTGVPWNLRVPWDCQCSVKKLNCIQHLLPLDTFSRLLVGPKCIWGRGSAPNPIGGSLQRTPRPPAGGEGAAPLHELFPLSACTLEFWVSGVRTKDTGSVSNQDCCKGFLFTEKVEKHSLRHYHDAENVTNQTAKKQTNMAAPHAGSESFKYMDRVVVFCALRDHKQLQSIYRHRLHNYQLKTTQL